MQVAQGHGHAAAIRRHDDGDAAALAISEEAQATDSRWPAGSGFAESKRPEAVAQLNPGPDHRHVARARRIPRTC